MPGYFSGPWFVDYADRCCRGNALIPSQLTRATKCDALKCSRRQSSCIDRKQTRNETRRSVEKPKPRVTTSQIGPCLVGKGGECGETSTRPEASHTRHRFTGEDAPMANLMLSVIGAVAQFERDLIRELPNRGNRAPAGRG
jgi:hypothetical protein